MMMSRVKHAVPRSTFGQRKANTSKKKKPELEEYISKRDYTGAAALLDVYPEAMIIQTHRDPIPMIASVCSLCWSSRSSMNAGTDIREFGRSTLALWERSIYTMMDAREKADPAQFYDLPFDRFVRDPVAAIRDIHDHFGLDYTDEADAAIRRFREDNPKGKHGTHRYTLDEYGLDEDEVRERFQRYTDAFAAVGAAPA